MATYAIGDIHGQLEALEGVLAQVEPMLEADDSLVFLGDYVDRGPDSRGVLDRLLRVREQAPCRVRYLRGNHEQWLLRTLDDPTRHSWFVGMNGWTTVASYSESVAVELQEEVKLKGFDLIKDKLPLAYERFFELMPPAHVALLRELEAFVRTPDVVCVHAGAEPGLPVEDQDTHTLLWGGEGLLERYDGPDRLVYGHWNDAQVEQGVVRPRRYESGLTYGIDSVAQGYLTCLRLPDERVFQAPVP